MSISQECIKQYISDEIENALDSAAGSVFEEVQSHMEEAICEIECDECGNILDCTYDVDCDGELNIKVEPCEECLVKAKSDKPTIDLNQIVKAINQMFPDTFEFTNTHGAE